MAPIESLASYASGFTESSAHPIMQVCRGPGHVEVRAPAKLNLFLEVLGKRPDGFHELETVMTPVALYDHLTFRDTQTNDIRLECAGIAEAQPTAPSDDKRVPEGAENIVVRAVELLRRRAGIERGAHIRLVKRIPVAAGMAGGSADAAAGLIAANWAWDLEWSDDQLAEIAAEIGSDVPFFFGRGAAVCRGRGERVEPLRGLMPLHFVVVAPPQGLRTADVFRACRSAERPKSAVELVEAWQRGDLARLGRLLHNGLQEPASRLCGSIERTAREFDRFDCLGHRMSGSGTSYFGLCRARHEARRIGAALAGRNLGQVFVVETTAN